MFLNAEDAIRVALKQQADVLIEAINAAPVTNACITVSRTKDGGETYCCGSRQIIRFGPLDIRYDYVRGDGYHIIATRTVEHEIPSPNRSRSDVGTKKREL